jgi:hypothetical protein
MDKHLLFIIWGLTLCVGAVVSVYFIRKSNRKFIEEEAEKEINKKKLAERSFLLFSENHKSQNLKS